MEGTIKELNGIQINIRKAKITALNFTFDDAKGINVDVSVGLLTGAGNIITSLNLSTNSWGEDRKLNITDVEADIFECAGDAINHLMPIVIRKINGIGKMLTQQAI